MKNKFTIIFIFICTIFPPDLVYGIDTLNNFSLKGKWKVIEYRSLLHSNQKGQDEEFRKFIIKERRKCLKSIINFDESKIEINTENPCNFISCDSLELSAIKVLPKLSDNALHYKYYGAEIVEYNMVSQEFLDMIHYNGKTLNYFDTNCLCQNGDFTLKILLKNYTDIVLFSGVTIIMLKRIK